jgi:hypothetical protein
VVGLTSRPKQPEGWFSRALFGVSGPHDFAVRVQVARPRAETFSDFRKDILWEALDNGRIVELAHEIGFATLAILQVERSCEL